MGTGAEVGMMIKYSGHRGDRPSCGWPQGIRWWQARHGEPVWAGLKLRDCDSAERSRHMGEHRKSRAERKKIRLGRHAGLGWGKGQRQCRRWKVSGLRGKVECCCRSSKEGVVTMPQAAKDGSESGLKRDLGLWPFRSLQ